MARNVTLAKIRGLARQYANQRPAGANAFIPDVAVGVGTSSVNDLINLAITEFYDILVAARGHEAFISSATLALVSGTAIYVLPADFYELFTMTLEWSATDHEVVPDLTSLTERAAFSNFSIWTQWAPKAYRVRGSSIEIVPTPTSAPICRIQYVPTFTDLVNDTDTLDGVNGWEKLVALRVAIEMRASAEQAGGDLMGLYQLEHQRISDMAADRAALATKAVKDVTPEGPMVWPVVRQRDP
jgi:hypothetical protein